MEAASSSRMSTSRVAIRQVFPAGIDTEAVRIEGATLWLMAYDDHAHIVRRGYFALRVIRQTISPILFALCMVGGLEIMWPITKDSPVLRVGHRSFAFAMPGLLYGIQFQKYCCEDLIATLTRVLMQFAYYEDHSERETGPGFSVPEFEPHFWSASQLKIERIAAPLLNRIGASLKISPPCVGVKEGVVKLLRMSKTVKSIARTILTGGLNAEHIDIFDTRSQPDHSKEPNSSRAFATIFAFSDMVEAMDVVGSIVSGNFRSLRRSHPTWTPLLEVKIWNINKKGLKYFVRGLVTASAKYMKKKMNGEAMKDDAKVAEAIKEEAKSKEPMEEEEVEKLEEIEEPKTLREITFPIIKGLDQRGYKHKEKMGETSASTSCLMAGSIDFEA